MSAIMRTQRVSTKPTHNPLYTSLSVFIKRK